MPMPKAVVATMMLKGLDEEAEAGLVGIGGCRNCSWIWVRWEESWPAW